MRKLQWVFFFLCLFLLGLTRMELPGPAHWEYLRGYREYQKGNLGQALAHFQQVVRYGNVPVALEAVQLLLEEGRVSEGLQLLNRLLADHPSPQVADLAGGIYLDLGRLKEAERLLLQAHRFAPSDPGILNDLAYVWLLQGKNLNSALQMALTALRQRPDNPMILDTVAWAYFLLGRSNQDRGQIEAGLWYARKSLSLLANTGQNPGLRRAQAEVRYHLSEIYRSLGMFTHAEVELKKALELNPSLRRQRLPFANEI